MPDARSRAAARQISRLHVESLFGEALALIASNVPAQRHAGIEALRIATDAWEEHYERFIAGLNEKLRYNLEAARRNG